MIVSTSMRGLLVLNPDVLVVPVADLPEETRSQIEYDPGDYALSRPQARTGSKIIDADAAALVSRFAEPRTLTDAVILFARERELDPVGVLETAHAFVRGLVDAGFLVSAGGAQDTTGEPAHGPRYPAGALLLGGTVQRTLAVLEDTEITVLARDGEISVLKIDRTSRDDGSAAATTMTARLMHEAAYLSALGGQIAPRLLATGTLDDRAYIEMELVQGVDASAAAGEHRAHEVDEGRNGILGLARRIAHVYADVHARGVLHGDVHPRNILVESSGAVRLVDFGVASSVIHTDALPAAAARGGIPFFFEPELARASLTGRMAHASAAGEQYGVAAVLWLLVTGTYCQQFRLGREAMLQDIANGELRTFTECGVAAWSALEAILRRALAKEPAERFGSMAAFADALDAVDAPDDTVRPGRWRATRSPLDEAMRLASTDGAWWNGSTPGPAASITYGAAGIAIGLLHVAQRHEDAQALALSDLWVRRAVRDSRRDDGFYNASIQITPDVVGRASPFHAISGVHAAAALVAAAQADPLSQAEAIAEYVASTERGANGLDVTVGEGSIALGAALILDALGPRPYVDTSALRHRGEQAIAVMWRELDARPAIPEAGIDYLGIAHGWAGYLYVSLLWSEVTGGELPADIERRLQELRRLAMPVGRGVEWPWLLKRGSQMTMPGWCNGTCGYVFLWNLAHRRLGRGEYAALADRCAWHAWEAPEPGPSICCGLSGRAYSLLNHYRHTGDRDWLQRAERLAHRAATDGARNAEFSHSLYKGAFGQAILLADLEDPDQSAMPFFEPAPRTKRTASA